MNGSSEKGRYVGLDFLKAVAAVLIVMHHYQQEAGAVFATFNFYPASDSQFNIGMLTILFFMISGFLTEQQELGEAESEMEKSLPSKFWHKCLRIYPMAVLSCCAYVLIGVLDWAVTKNWHWYAGGGGIWTFFCSITLSAYMGIWESAGLVNNAPLWYLSALISAYATYYLLVYFSRKCKIPRLLSELILFLFLCAARTQSLQLPFFGNSWDQKGGIISFLFGALLCHMAPYLPRKAKRFLLMISGVTVVVLLSNRGDWIENQWWVQLFMLYPGIFLNALYLKDARDSKCCQIIHFLGKVSYEVYLWHSPLFMLEMLILDISGITIPCTYGVIILFAIVVELFAIPLYLFLEKPLAYRMKHYEWDKLKVVDPV